RAGSFFIQPDASSAFLAMLLLVPLGLFVESASLLRKALFLIEMIVILIALLFTYSTGAWLAAGVGVIVFVVLVGSVGYRVQIPLYIGVGAAILLLFFSPQVNLLFQ